MTDKITNSINIEELEKSEEIYRGIIESSDAIVFAISKDLKYLKVNKIFAQNIGRLTQDIVGKSIFDIFPKIAADKLAKNIKEIFDTNKGLFIEEKIVIHGQDTYNSSSLNPIINDKGEVIAISGIVRDITIKKKEEEELRKIKDDIVKAAEKFHIYMQKAPIGIFVSDEVGNYIDANEMACNMSGYSKEELLKISIKDFLAPEYIEEGFKVFNTVKLTGYANAEVMVRRKNGEIFWINLVTAAINEGKNFLAFCEDISKKVESEKKLTEKYAEMDKFYKLTVGRELNMVGLKNKIKELETKLADKDVKQKD